MYMSENTMNFFTGLLNKTHVRTKRWCVVLQLNKHLPRQELSREVQQGRVVKQYQELEQFSWHFGDVKQNQSTPHDYDPQHARLLNRSIVQWPRPMTLNRPDDGARCSGRWTWWSGDGKRTGMSEELDWSWWRRLWEYAVGRPLRTGNMVQCDRSKQSVAKYGILYYAFEMI